MSILEPEIPEPPPVTSPLSPKILSNSSSMALLPILSFEKKLIKIYFPSSVISSPLVKLILIALAVGTRDSAIVTPKSVEDSIESQPAKGSHSTINTD